MKKILIILVHPNLINSSVNLNWKIAASKLVELVEIHELYKKYPTWEIDVKKEQELLLKYDKIIFQFPLYWYSYPPLLKKWFDDVFTYSWAYGSKGDKLKNKIFTAAVSAGDIYENYQTNGEVGITIDELLTPLKATATKVKANFVKPFILFGVNYGSSGEAIEKSCKDYIKYIQDFARN